MDAELKNAYRYCRNLARAKAGNFYYAFIFLPKSKRQAIYALYAFCQYCDRIVDEILPGENPRHNVSKLRQELSDALQGRQKSPLFIALIDSINRYKLPINYFYSIIDGVESDIQRGQFKTFKELKNYCFQVASTVGLLCVEIFGYLDQRVCKYAENLGYALQLTNILRDVKEDAQRGRIYLPVEDLEYFGYKAEDIARGVVNDNFLKMMNFQYDRALTFYRQAEETLPPLERKAQVASEIMKTIYRELLELIKKQKFNVFDRRIRVNKFKKSQLALFTFMKIMLGK